MPSLSISVVVPCYALGKRFELLRDCVAALVAQSRLADEVLFVDDGSPDNTTELLERLVDEERSLRGRLRVLPLTENGGASISRNAGIRAARGDIVAFCDYDDLWFPNYLERLEAAFSEDPDRMWVLARTIFQTRYKQRQKCAYGEIPANINSISFESLCAYCVEQNFPVAMGSAIACRRAAFETDDSLWFDTFLSKRTAEDVFFGYQWLLAGMRPHFLLESAVVHRTLYTHVSRSKAAFFSLDEAEVFRYFEEYAFGPLIERIATHCPERVPQIHRRLKKSRDDFMLKSLVMRSELGAALLRVVQRPRLAKSLIRFLLLRMVERFSLDALLNRYLFWGAPSSEAAENEAISLLVTIERLKVRK